MKKTIKADKEIQFCDICDNPVGELQITDKYEEHICFACYGYRFIAWANKDKTDYQKSGSYKFDYDKINRIVLEEMRRQVKSGIGKY